MRNVLRWTVPGESFEDGSRLSDWTKIERHSWHWQYDDRELTFDIYEHAGQYWKLYRTRWVREGTTQYRYGYGGQACRVSLVEYQRRTRSPHSHLLKEIGNLEWVRTYEVDPELHRVVRTGRSPALDDETGAGTPEALGATQPKGDASWQQRRSL